MRRPFEVQSPGVSEVADRVAEAHAAAYLGREVFDEGQVVAVQAVAEVEGVDGEDLRVVRLRNRVRSAQVEERVAGGARLGREDSILILDERRLGLYVESLVAPINPDAAAHGRDARERSARLLQLRVDVVEAEVEPERFVRRNVEAHLSPAEAAVGLVVVRLNQVLAYLAGRREEDEV